MLIFTDKFKRVHNRELVRSGRKAQLGRVYQKSDGTEAREIVCRYCGAWVRYDMKEMLRFVRELRWDPKKNRLLHCGNSSCYEYDHLCDESRKTELAKYRDRVFENLYMKLKRQNKVA